MAKDELKKFYEVLELPADAPLRDVHNSFLRLKKLYSGDSIVLAPLGEEFSEKKRKKILEQIEEAYAKILAARKDESSGPAALHRGAARGQLPEKVVSLPPRIPALLKKARDKAGID